ncbi:hypothetical protein BDV96DRAFT_649771 [Lophiotrema nucula]|uniref:Uncharacterized protein n=1 Tax=Lophiotrema nucula TaxID=690887 RepID=A0A6A5YY99_9PLEO|nr:hypothetical protein BDV96DRAFT_649771 [Lophiotrema nucula]
MAKLIIAAEAHLNVTIVFNVPNTVQPERRKFDAVSLKFKPALIPPGVTAPTFVQNPQAPDTARMRMAVTYDDKKITRLQLQQRIIADAKKVDWQDLYKLQFS